MSAGDKAWRASVITLLIGGTGFGANNTINNVGRREFEAHVSDNNRRWSIYEAQRAETIDRLMRDIDQTRRAIERIEGILLRQNAVLK